MGELGISGATVTGFKSEGGVTTAFVARAF
jgi:hypothetical protein